MSSDFDEMVNQMQDKILADMREIYSEEVIELFLHPKNKGCGRVWDIYRSLWRYYGDLLEDKR